VGGGKPGSAKKPKTKPTANVATKSDIDSVMVLLRAGFEETKRKYDNAKVK
jgi:hypothetical protein